ncbi:UDP-glucose 4-epimerase [Paenibacillus dendritiformis]|uniref:NAD-dependent epimerase/dehydratase family protein n=1 Tax=Paenibacillus dendritiformis TaxID=130049 RepID=UPI0018CD3E3B|nr:NAD-dependent epimerase/dehydratase family protein [Paenibacillus dendritiformis]MBG9791547.1 UDP-glucose 4-epimerase [Paenibacillus dendritiformis]
MKAVVTGGAGFIGSHLAEALLDQGADVHVIDNLSSGRERRVPRDAELHVADIRSEHCDEIILRIRPDILFHLAGQVDVARSVHNPGYDASIRGTVRLLSVCRESGIRKFIFASTAAVYGNMPEGRTTEQSPICPVSYYGLSKWAAESYIRLFHLLYGIPYTILRYSNEFGPRQVVGSEGGVIAAFIRQLHEDGRIRVHGDGEQARDFIHVHDVVQANLAAARSGEKETIHVSTGVSVTLNRLIGLLQKIHGSGFEIEYGPAREGDIKHSCLDNRLAWERLQWRPSRSLAEGVLEMYRDYAARKMDA